MKPTTLRGLTCAAVFVAVAVGLLFSTGFGTPSSFGWSSVAWLCPLGSLEVLLGSWAFVPRLFILIAVAAVVVFFVGKGFCSFVCPVPHIQTLFRTKKRKKRAEHEKHAAAEVALARYKNGEKPKRRAGNVDGRHVVLAGALASAAVFGFPVFCLVCPVGLTIATFIAVWQLVQSNALTVGLVVFPVIVIVEVVVLRRWCHALCPLGALFSLISQKSVSLKPQVDYAVCLREREGKDCSVCSAVCGEFVDPHSDLGVRPLSECVKCGKCAAACPAKAIAFKLTGKRPRP